MFASLWMVLASTIGVSAETEVDVELFLAVDVSRSMSPYELEIQRLGYASALQSDEVIGAILNGAIGRIAIKYVEWAGTASQDVIVPWTLIDDAEDARDVAGQISANFDASMRRTSISQILRYAADDIDSNGFIGLRRVIDVSGDGPNNQGAQVDIVRDAVVARGIIINGLPLMTQDALSARWGIDDLDEYYRRCVIGGPGAFVVPVLSWDQFEAAVRRKLVLEIGNLMPEPQVIPAQYQRPAPHNCLVGEEMWERNRIYFDMP